MPGDGGRFFYDTCEVGVFLGCACAFTDAATELDDGVTAAVDRLQQVGVPEHRLDQLCKKVCLNASGILRVERSRVVRQYLKVGV